MMARWFFALVVSAAFAGSGCCCLPRPCGPCGPCLPCLPQPIVWRGGCNECGPSACEPCGSCCNECGILPFFRRGLTCGKGCGEIYVNEWVSDPPDCCDPCDKCHGQWTGAQGPCCLGPFQRILAAFHGYSYCERPYAGPWCPPCGKPVCGPTCGPNCGCGGEMAAHGADIYYEGPTTHGASTMPHIEGKSILEENWDAPKAKPEPGKPIHKAEQPSRPQMTRRSPPMQQSAVRQPPISQQPVGTGVRQANYQR